MFEASVTLSWAGSCLSIVGVEFQSLVEMGESGANNVFLRPPTQNSTDVTFDTILYSKESKKKFLRGC